MASLATIRLGSLAVPGGVAVTAVSFILTIALYAYQNNKQKEMDGFHNQPYELHQQIPKQNLNKVVPRRSI